jgi:hypothetical protein
MGERYVTLAEIEAAYPNQWVLIVKIRSDRYQNMLGAHVVAAGPDREELYRQLGQLPTSEMAGVIHTSVRPWTVGPEEPLAATLFRWLILLCLVMGVCWVTHKLTIWSKVPEGVRIFNRVSDPLESHFKTWLKGVSPMRQIRTESPATRSRTNSGRPAFWAASIAPASSGTCSRPTRLTAGVRTG